MTREQINLIYFGRITESKNIDIIIKVLSVLLKEGYQAKLDLIGGYTEDYYCFLKSYEKEELMPIGSVVFHGAQPLSYITERLKSAHYFIFPSQEKKEGHSNSLTEAMAFGVVPIVSQAGFNASICGDNQLVVNELSPHLFAQRIIDIEKKGEWEYFSRFVYNRVIEQFTEKQALEKLKQALRTVGINCGD